MSWADQFALDLTAESGVKSLGQLIEQLATNLSPFASAVVLDSVYSYSALAEKAGSCGLILRLERPQPEVDPLALPQLVANWGVEDIRQNYAAAKFELYYHPQEPHALEKKKIVAELHDYCRHVGIAFLLKLVIYDPAGGEYTVSSFQETQMVAVQEFAKFADVLLLQYPQDALACATISAELDIPWIFTINDVTYETYKDALRVSLENGASGYQVTEAIWKEATGLRREDSSPDFGKIEDFIKTSARDRVIELERIAKELVGHQTENT